VLYTDIKRLDGWLQPPAALHPQTVAEIREERPDADEREVLASAWSPFLAPHSAIVQQAPLVCATSTECFGVRMTDIWVLLLGAALGVGGTLAAYAIADALVRRKHRHHPPRNSNGH
jgi:hypothetical protein